MIGCYFLTNQIAHDQRSISHLCLSSLVQVTRTWWGEEGLQKSCRNPVLEIILTTAVWLLLFSSSFAMASSSMQKDSLPQVYPVQCIIKFSSEERIKIIQIFKSPKFWQFDIARRREPSLNMSLLDSLKNVVCVTSLNSLTWARNVMMASNFPMMSARPKR